MSGNVLTTAALQFLVTTPIRMERRRQLGEQRLRTGKEGPLAGCLDLYPGDQRMGGMGKGGCLIRGAERQVGSGRLDHLQDMQIPDPLCRDAVTGDQIQNGGAHAGEIDIQFGQRSVEIENDGFP